MCQRVDALSDLLCDVEMMMRHDCQCQAIEVESENLIVDEKFNLAAQSRHTKHSDHLQRRYTPITKQRKNQHALKRKKVTLIKVALYVSSDVNV